MNYSMYIRHINIRFNIHEGPFRLPLTDAEQNILQNYSCRTDLLPNGTFFYKTGGEFPEGRYYLIYGLSEQDKLILSLLDGIIIDMPNVTSLKITSACEYMGFPPYNLIMGWK